MAITDDKTSQKGRLMWLQRAADRINTFEMKFTGRIRFASIFFEVTLCVQTEHIIKFTFNLSS